MASPQHDDIDSIIDDDDAFEEARDAFSHLYKVLDDYVFVLAQEDADLGRNSGPIVKDILRVLRNTRHLERARRQAEVVTPQLENMCQEMLAMIRCLSDMRDAMQTSDHIEITCLDYDLVRAAQCGKSCMDDLIYIGVVPSDHRHRDQLDALANFSIMWHDVVTEMFELLVETMQTIDSAVSEEEFDLTPGELRRIILPFDLKAIIGLGDTHQALLEICRQRQSQAVLDLVLHWKQMRSDNSALDA